MTLRTLLVQEERTTYYDNFLVFFIVFNGFIAVLSSISNTIVIYTISVTPALRTPSNILILGLALSDLGVSVLSQPCYCLLLVAEQRRDIVLICPASAVNFISIWIFASISFVTLVTISADRYLAIHLHLRYKEIVTNRRYIKVLILIWILGIFAGIIRNFLSFSDAVAKVVFGLFAVLFACLVLLNTYFIIKISVVVHRHSVQIQAQQQPQPTMNMPRYKKSVYTIYCVMSTFVFCYVPYVVLIAAARVSKLKRTEQIAYLYTVSETLVMVNGVLNPLIYFWRMQEIRSAAFRLFKKSCA